MEESTLECAQHHPRLACPRIEAEIISEAGRFSELLCYVTRMGIDCNHGRSSSTLLPYTPTTMHAIQVSCFKLILIDGVNETSGFTREITGQFESTSPL